MNLPPNLAGELTGDDVARLSAEDADRRFGCHILDVRAEADDHLPGSARIPVRGDSLQADELPAHLLPSRPRPFVVVAETAIKSRHMAVSLRGRGHQAGICLDGIPRQALRAGAAVGELWRPDAYVAACLPLLPPPSAGPVLDLGAGSGRDGVFLAAQGYDCLLVDRHPESLAMAEARAARQGVTIRTETLDLREAHLIPAGPYAVALSVRFLRRNVLAALGDLLAPRGMFLLHTFTGDPEKLIGPPRRLHLRLQPKELDTFFSAPRWRRVHGPVVESCSDNARIAVLLENSS